MFEFLRRENGCTAHDFERQHRNGTSYRIQWDSPHYVIEKRDRVVCRHEGCTEWDERWVTIARIGVNKDNDGEPRDGRLDDFHDILNTLTEWDDDE